MSSTEDPFRKYFDPRTIARVEGLELKARRIVEGLVSGQHRSPYRGASVEFAEHREYSPGEDLRYLDWKVFGKTDRFYLKTFAEESNLTCYLVLDHSRSMTYRSAPDGPSKLEFACLLAACLSYLIVRQQDAVGVFTVNHKVTGSVRPSGQPAQLRSIVQLLESLEASGETNLRTAVQELVGRIPQRSVVILISDLLTDLEGIRKAFAQLQSRKHDVAVLQILDRAEVEFPFAEPTRFHGLETCTVQACDPNVVRQEYLRELRAFLGQVERAGRQFGMDLEFVRTDQPPELVLRRFLSSRGRGGRQGGGSR